MKIKIGLPVSFIVGGLLIVSTALLEVDQSYAEWLNNGQPVRESSWAKTNGEFGAQLFFTDQPAKQFAAWNEDTRAVKVFDTEKIRRNHTIVPLIVFSNCQADKAGLANVTVNYEIISPNGEVYATAKDLEVWVNRQAPQHRDLELSVDTIYIKLNNKSDLGLYTVKADVFDKNAKLGIHLERQFSLLK